MSLRNPFVLAVLALGCAASADAQSVRVQFNNGLVSVSAQNAPLRQILAEWAKLGGTTFVNAERVPGGPVTLQLDNVSERHALDVLLRSVSGYMVAARPAGLVGASNFDRILIVPTSTATAVNAGAPRPPQQQTFQPPRMSMPQPEPEPEVTFDPDDPEENPPDDIAPEEPLKTICRVIRGCACRSCRRTSPAVRCRRSRSSRIPTPMPNPRISRPQRRATRSACRPGSARPGTVTPVPQQRDRQPQPDPEP